MNTRLLKLARKDSKGVWHWVIPGYGNGVKYNPHGSGVGTHQWGASLRWPGKDAKGELVHSVDLARHRKQAKQEIRKLLQSVKGEV